MTAPSHRTGLREDGRFDIVLVLDYFRSAAPLLCLIHAFARTCRIGLCIAPLAPDMLRKAGANQEEFVTSCLEAGAKLVEGCGHECDLMIVQQRPYDDSVARSILSGIRPRRVVGLMALAMAGMPAHEAYLRQFGIAKVYVPNLRLMRFLLAARDSEVLYRNICVEQVGLPFARMPLEPEFAADWIIATPTTFSFREESHKHAFLHTVLSLLRQIGPDAIVVYKPHNGDYRDYLAPEGYARIAHVLCRLPGALPLTAALGRLPGPAGRAAAKLHTCLLHDLVLRRCVPLRAATSRDWLPLEAFLPRVRKGVIGGLSNTIWGTHYFGLPFYNCVDPQLRESVPLDPSKGHKDSVPYLDLNLRFFGVPFCEARLDSPHALSPGLIEPQDLDGDLIAAVERDLVELRSAAM